MSKNYEQCLGIYKKNINNAYKNISSALCPHSLLVVSIMTRAARNSWPCHWQYQGHGLLMQLIRYRTVAKFFFFFFTGGCDPTRRRTKQGRRYKYLGGKLGCLAETALREFCKTLISLFFNFKTDFFCVKGTTLFYNFWAFENPYSSLWPADHHDLPILCQACGEKRGASAPVLPPSLRAWYTVEPPFNEVAGDRPNLFVKSRVR